MKIQKIYLDFNNLESIKKAERKKAFLENKGYNLKKDICAGFEKHILIYELN